MLPLVQLLDDNLAGISEEEADWRPHPETHTLHLAGHRFQVRFVRGMYSRARGTSKAAFDPW